MTARLNGRPATFGQSGGAALSSTALFVRVMVLMLAMLVMVVVVVMAAVMVGFSIDRGHIKSIVQRIKIRRAFIPLNSVKH